MIKKYCFGDSFPGKAAARAKARLLSEKDRCGDCVCPFLLDICQNSCLPPRPHSPGLPRNAALTAAGSLSIAAGRDCGMRRKNLWRAEPGISYDGERTVPWCGSGGKWKRICVWETGNVRKNARSLTRPGNSCQILLQCNIL